MESYFWMAGPFLMALARRAAPVCVLAYASAHAGDPCVTCTNKAGFEEIRKSEEYRSLINRFSDQLNPKPEPKETGRPVFDGIFLFDIQRDRHGVSVSSVNTAFGNSTDPGQMSLGFVGELYASSRGSQPLSLQESRFNVPVRSLTPARSFSESIALIRANASKLSREEKLYFLNRLGTELRAGYDYSIVEKFPPRKTDLEQLFRNWREGGTQGGVCRDISTYLAEVARALGYQAVGTHSGISGSGGRAGLHQISHFRDPQTGEYYVQNYGTIFNTHQKSLPEALDVSTRAMGALTGISYVESLPKKTHPYTPKLMRWVQGKLDVSAEWQEQPAYVTAKVSQKETTLGLQYQVQEKAAASAKMIKGFFLRSEVETSEGPVRLQAIGVAGEIGKNKELSQSVLDEVGYAAKTQFGWFEIRNEKIGNIEGYRTQKRNNIFLGTNISGHARINQLTGKLELETKVMDLWTSSSRTGAPLSGVNNKLTPSVEYQIAPLPVSLDYGRTLEVVPTNQGTDLKMQTAYDKISIVLDRRGGEDRILVVNKAEAYLFGGAEKRDAVAVRDLFKVAIPTEKKGEFAMVLDLSKFVENRFKDPFYDLPFSSSVRGEWKKALGRIIEIGTGVEARYGAQPFFLFEQLGTVTPDLAPKRKTEVKGDLWLRMRF